MDDDFDRAAERYEELKLKLAAALIAKGNEDAAREVRELGPATSADLLELDAVPEPVDSAEPAAVHARTLARARP